MGVKYMHNHCIVIPWDTNDNSILLIWPKFAGAFAHKKATSQRHRLLLCQNIGKKVRKRRKRWTKSKEKNEKNQMRAWGGENVHKSVYWKYEMKSAFDTHMQNAKSHSLCWYVVWVLHGSEINDSISFFLSSLLPFAASDAMLPLVAVVVPIFLIESIPSRCFVFFSWHSVWLCDDLNNFFWIVSSFGCVCMFAFFPVSSSLFLFYLFKRKVSFELLPTFLFPLSFTLGSFVYFPPFFFFFFFFFDAPRNFTLSVRHIRPKRTNRLTWRLQSFTMQYRENLKPITIFHCRQKW